MEGGGAAAAGGGIPDLGDTITVDDLELQQLQRGTSGSAHEGEGQAPAGSGGAEAGKGDAGAGQPAAEDKPVFVVFPGGQKVQLGKDGTITDEVIQKALSGKYVPEDVYHRKIEEARRTVRSEAAKSTERPQAKAEEKPKAPDPFVRAKNEIDKEEDHAAWLEFEREQDRLELKHELAARDAADRERWGAIQQQLSQTIAEGASARDESGYEKDYDDTFAGLDFFPQDTPERKDAGALLWNLVNYDPRHPRYSKMEGVEETLPISQLVAEHAGAIKNLVKAEVKAALASIEKTTGKSTSEPHAGGGTSMAAKAGEGAQGRRHTSIPLKEGETPAQSVARALAAGQRAPRG